MIKVLIADDHEVVREGLKTFLRGEKDMKVVGEATNGFEVVELLKKKECDVLVLDISLPGKDGMDILREVKKHHPRLPVLFLTMHPEERFAIRAFKAGASGYVTKELAAKELMKAIRKVVEGGKYVSDKLAETLASELIEGSGKLPHETLSNREFQIMGMLASGKNMKTIAQILSLSYGTVFTYRKRILTKLKLQTDVDLTRYVMENRLLD